MARQVVIKASEGHRAFGKLLKRIYGSDEHLIIERDGFPVAVMMSYQEYEHLGQLQTDDLILENLPLTMSLEEAFGSVTPISRPEDFAAIRDAAIEDHVQNVVRKMNHE
jgi:PHD/YefM family antitoxin component YafN of YafNO toxin-antitoxin module